MWSRRRIWTCRESRSWLRPTPNEVNVAWFRIGIIGVSGYGGGEALSAQRGASGILGRSRLGRIDRRSETQRRRFPGISPKLADLKIRIVESQSDAEVDLLLRIAADWAFERDPGGCAAKREDRRHRRRSSIRAGLDVRPGGCLAREDSITSTRVANPGCYPSASLAAIAPLVGQKWFNANHPIIIDAKSGVSGAGRGGGDSKFGFAEVNEDVSAYGLSKHVHTPEMLSTVHELAGNNSAKITFTPHLIPMTRGILATCYVPGEATAAQCLEAAREVFTCGPAICAGGGPAAAYEMGDGIESGVCVVCVVAARRAGDRGWRRSTISAKGPRGKRCRMRI